MVRLLSQMIDWDRNRKLLTDASRLAFAAFLRQRKQAEVCAVGYVFDLWNLSPTYLCANSQDYYRQQLAMYRAKHPRLAEDEIRWNSGDYAFPAGLLSPDELGAVWNAEVERLHGLPNVVESYSVEVYNGLVRISCETLAILAREGLFGDWRRVDFNVSDVSDEGALVRERDRGIRERIALV